MNLKVLLFAVAVTSLSLTARAQSAPASGVPLVVSNLPFTAQEWTQITFTRPDGSTVKTARRVDVTRNSAGSTRRELRLLPNSSPTAQPTGSLSVDIHDAPNHLATHLDTIATTATVTTFSKPQKPSTIPVSVPVGAVVAAPTQDLGYRSIAGLMTSGSRQTFLFPRGTKDPDQDVTQTKDTWYSPDLQAVLLTEIKDSLNNSTVTAISQIVQGEPDPTLFTIPQNYAITTTKSAQSPQ